MLFTLHFTEISRHHSPARAGGEGASLFGKEARAWSLAGPWQSRMLTGLVS